MNNELEIPEDDKSPWISTSRNLTWCIYGISRRLALFTQENEGDTVVEMAIIKHHSGTVGLSDGKRDVWEVHVDPKGPMGKTLRDGKVGSWVQPGGMSVALKSDFMRARKGCEVSGEVLYFGRIFGVNIEENWEWSGSMGIEVRDIKYCYVGGVGGADASIGFQDLPLELPVQFLAPKKPKKRFNDGSSDTDDSKILKGWLGGLVWDPLRDSFWDAEKKIRDRARDLGRIGG